MTLEEEILINKYAQGLIDIKDIETLFVKNTSSGKRELLMALVDLIIQSKPTDEDVKPAIRASGLKETYTPCVLLLKGVTRNNLDKVIDLPETEQAKTLNMLMHLFKIAYLRRYDLEKGHPHKWWYWDLSDDKVIELIRTKSL